MSLVYPVIHNKNQELTIQQANLAYQAGADGIFLISHCGKDNEILITASLLRENFTPKFNIGVNLLSTNTVTALELVKQSKLDMLWGDVCGVSSRGLNEMGESLSSNLDTRLKYSPMQLFASVAFKYQPIDPDPVRAGRNALEAGFIPTTSGSATGEAPTVDKIRDMSEGTHGLLAVASGMTVDNINLYKPYLSHILVSTGVSKNGYEFDTELLSSFIELCHN